MRINITAALLISAFLQIGLAANAQYVTFSKKNTSFEEVLKEIQKQTGYNFIYTDQMMAEAKAVDVRFKNAPIEEVLKRCFSDQSLTYTVNQKTVIIRRRSILAKAELPPITINGKVTDSVGLQLAGVSVMLKGSTMGTVTDIKGSYSLNIPSESGILVFSYIGFKTQEVTIKGPESINVTLMPEPSALSEVVVVGYGTQKKVELTGSVASIGSEELVKASSTNISNALAGRLPGLIAVNGNGKPGSGSQISIRGVSTIGDNSALVVVDGIVRGFEQIDPNEIESISILKDASATAVYGSRAANGVILITTKRGRTGKPTVNYNSFIGIQNPTVYPRLMNGLEYVTTKNVARENMGLPPAYSAQEIADIQQGLVPETNWYDLTLKKQSFQTQQNLSVDGGTKAIKYFMSVGYLDQDGLYDNLNYKRYSVRSNVDANINKNLVISADIDASVRNNNGSGYSPESIFSDILAAYPFDLTNNPDGTIFYTHEQHPVEEINTGYDKNVANILQTTLSFKQELPFVPGLSISGKASFGKESSTGKFYQVPILMNRQDENGETLEIYPYGGWNGKTALTQSFAEYNTTTLNANLSYKQTFGDHGINGILLFEQFDAKASNFFGFRTNFPANGLDELSYGGQIQKDANGGSFNDGRRSAVARLDYSYKDRYLFEVSFREDGSIAFPTRKKYGFFPAGSVGWRISEESFVKNNSTFDYIDNLKIRASYGTVGNDRNVYMDPSRRVPTFQYQQVYDLSSTIISGKDALSSVSPGVLPNPYVTWESAAITNVGLDGSLWNRKLSFEIDAFYKRTSNILLSRIRSIPSTIGAALPAENYAKVDNKGIEFSLGHENRANDFNYFIKLNGSFSKSKVILLDEPANIPDYLLQTGRPLGFITGYSALGYFQTEEEIANYYPQFNGGQKPGDVKYADINGDEKVDANDLTIISMDNGTPKILAGLSFGGSYKGFDLSILFQGATKMKKMLAGRSVTFFNGGSQNNFADLLDYWTPENRNAEYPRPWENQNVNNSLASSLYLRDASYIRLKSVDLGYTLPSTMINKLKFKTLRIYASGTNLFFLDKMKMFDPEVENTDGAYYPQQRTLNLGVNLTF